MVVWLVFTAWVREPKLEEVWDVHALGLRVGTPVCGGDAAQALFVVVPPDWGGLAHGFAGGEVGLGEREGRVVVLVWKGENDVSGVMVREVLLVMGDVA